MINRPSIEKSVGLTEEQCKLFNDAIVGGEATWPLMTSDPAVNYAVDCWMDYEDFEGPYNSLRSSLKKTYELEAKYFSESNT